MFVMELLLGSFIRTSTKFDWKCKMVTI